MARSKQEIRNWLRSKVGTTVNDKVDPSLNGQCPTLIKALLEFIGAPEPYKARGHGKDYATTLVNEGIANQGKGWLQICSTPNLSKPYGHVWVDLLGETNFEQNGRKYLVTTEGTRPYSQARVIVNLDKYITDDNIGVNTNIPAGHTEEQGTFTATVDRNIRRQPGLNGEIIDTLFTAGSSVAYDCKIAMDNFMWISWIGNSGNRNYTAVRRLSDNRRYGKIK